MAGKEGQAFAQFFNGIFNGCFISRKQKTENLHSARDHCRDHSIHNHLVVRFNLVR